MKIPEMCNAATDRLNDYLRGYGRNKIAKLKELSRSSDWQAGAAQELQSRRLSLLAVFDDELLHFIQRGSIDVQAAARAVAQELKDEEDRNTSAFSA